MAGASIEAALAHWASSLRDVKGRIRPLFTQERVAASAGAFLDGLLAQLGLCGTGRYRRPRIRRQPLGLWTRGLLIRRRIADQDLAFFSTWAPAGTSIEKLVRVEGHRWAIEDSFETAKNELGLDHNETRSWHGWNRHVSLVMLAFAMMATIRQVSHLYQPRPKTAAAAASA
jgi:SRSO17 transposase